MEENYRKFLENITLKIDESLETLTKIHCENIDKLEEDYQKSVNKIIQQKKKIEDIISNLYSPDPNVYYAKQNNISDMSQENFEEEKKRWKIDNVKSNFINESIYIVKDILELNEWKKYDIAKCIHNPREVVLTFCKTPHCKECLRNRIEKNDKTCLCNKKLSPKNLQEVMGFDYHINID